MIERIINMVFGLALLGGLGYLVNATEEHWPLDEDRPLAEQVSNCRFANLHAGVDNILEAIRVAGMRIDGHSAVDLALYGLPDFAPRADCFANLTEEQAKAVIASRQYADTQLEIYRQMDRFIAPIRGF